ncbi:alanine--tRNA ligase-related protein [Sphingomonas sp. MMS24-JH45]
MEEDGGEGHGRLWFDLAEEVGATEFTGYSSDTGEGVVLALVKDGVRVDRAAVGDSVDVIVNQTPFYGESGGQVGDAGTLSGDDLAATVTDTSKQLGKLWVHHATIEAGAVKVGDGVKLAIDVARRGAIRANHSATHLLHEALRQRLGTHVAQKGSLVAPERLRFDVSHSVAMSPAELADAEAAVNAKIRQNGTVTTRLIIPDDAIAMGAMALFGEKYGGTKVRVVSMGTEGDGSTYSVELCGGTHAAALGDIGLFKIVGEGAVSSGVRRVEALTGEAARAYLSARDKLREAAATLKTAPDDVPAQLRGAGRGAAPTGTRACRGEEGAGAVRRRWRGAGGAGGRRRRRLHRSGARRLRCQGAARRGGRGEAAARFGRGDAGRGQRRPRLVAVGVTADLTARFNAVELTKAAVAALGGQGGGGRPDMAQGGGPEGAKAADAVAAVKAALEEAAAA